MPRAPKTPRTTKRVRIKLDFTIGYNQELHGLPQLCLNNEKVVNWFISQGILATFKEVMKKHPEIPHPVSVVGGTSVQLSLDFRK